MKCQNMKIADVLFFTVNLITIYSTHVQEAIVPSESTPLENEVVLKKTLAEDCPADYLSRIIRGNDFTNYTFDCKMLNVKKGEVNVEYILQEACFEVKNVLKFVCDRKYTVTPDLFKLNSSEPVCPFNFSHIQPLGFKFSVNESQMVKELTLKEHCLKVCLDLYSVRPQCAVLSRLSNYLKRQLLINQNTPPMEVDGSKPEYSVPAIQEVESSSLNKNEGMEKQSTKSKTKDNKESKVKNESDPDVEGTLSGAGKNITKSMREEKTEKVITSVPNEEGMPKTEIKISENENLMPQDDEFKSPLDDQNEDLINEDDVGVIADSVSDRSDVGKVDKISASPPKDKEIYPAEGFFQAEDSHFFFYFIMASSIIVVGYLAFHNKNKILAYALEGSSTRRSRRRPNPARYRKLETNLEEAISSNAVNSAASNVVY